MAWTNIKPLPRRRGRPLPGISLSPRDDRVCVRLGAAVLQVLEARRGDRLELLYDDQQRALGLRRAKTEIGFRIRTGVARPGSSPILELAEILLPTELRERLADGRLRLDEFEVLSLEDSRLVSFPLPEGGNHACSS
jgi:hypothetical protein